ncbi:MAG: metallophosphoesterase [bacterium]
MFTTPSIAALEARLGAKNFHHRLRAEQALLRPMRRFAESPRANAAKQVLSSPVIRLCFRLLGLHRRGYHQFMNPLLVDHVVRLPNLPPALEGLTLLQLSDLHLDLDPGFVPALAKLLNGLAYDLAVITGDFRNLTAGPTEPTVAGTLALMQHLRAPVFAVTGNHDPLALVPPLEAAGVRFLLNEHVVWKRGGAALVVAGVDDAVYHEAHDLKRAFAHAPKDAIRVLLSHSPALYTEAPAYGVQLFLAGHTHGGQICLPGGHMILTGVRGPRRYLRGSWTHAGMQGYTSSGTGACGVPLRFNSPAEITRHVFTRGPALPA